MHNTEVVPPPKQTFLLDANYQNNSEVDLRGCLRAIKAQFQPTLNANDLDWNIKTNSTSIT